MCVCVCAKRLLEKGREETERDREKCCPPVWFTPKLSANCNSQTWARSKLGPKDFLSPPTECQGHYLFVWCLPWFMSVDLD